MEVVYVFTSNVIEEMRFGSLALLDSLRSVKKDPGLIVDRGDIGRRDSAFGYSVDSMYGTFDSCADFYPGQAHVVQPYVDASLYRKPVACLFNRGLIDADKIENLFFSVSFITHCNFVKDDPQAWKSFEARIELGSGLSLCLFSTGLVDFSEIDIKAVDLDDPPRSRLREVGFHQIQQVGAIKAYLRTFYDDNRRLNTVNYAEVRGSKPIFYPPVRILDDFHRGSEGEATVHTGHRFVARRGWDNDLAIEVHHVANRGIVGDQGIQFTVPFEVVRQEEEAQIIREAEKIFLGVMSVSMPFPASVHTDTTFIITPDAKINTDKA